MNHDKNVNTPLKPHLGIALSGGGVRASLFALGALLYLIDTKFNERVSEISSVSGGSITSGFIAQRCDFSTPIDASEFDKHASELALAITTGLLSKRFVVATYGIMGLMVLSIVVFSQPFGLPWWADVILTTTLGAALLLRGALVAYLLQRRLFTPPDRPDVLGAIVSSVAHVFCATDLNSGMPVYLTNVGAHLLSPAWGQASANKAANIGIADAVRASAAFPFGIPPKRLDIEKFELEPTPIQQIKRWAQLVFRDVARPTALYLADGGVWNNLGTDWFQSSTRTSLGVLSDHQLRAEEIIVVDASAPTAAKSALPLLRFPWLGELAAPFRVLAVLYSSTVMSRIQEIEAGEKAEDRGNRCVLARMVDPFSAMHRCRFAWLGYPDTWSGQIDLFSVLKRLTKLSTLRKEWVVRSPREFHLWNSRVPTTLFAIPREIAVQLLIHGYVSMERAITTLHPDLKTHFPGVDRFAKLLKLNAEWNHQLQCWVLETRSKLTGKLIEQLIASLKDTVGSLAEASTIAEEADTAAGRQLEESKKLLDDIRKSGSENAGPTTSEVRATCAIMKAAVAIAKKDYATARYAFETAFNRVDLSDDSVSPSDVALYAKVIARLDDARATETVAVAESKAKAAQSETGSEETRAEFPLVWYITAEAYGLLGDSEAAVRCLTKHSQIAAQQTAEFLASSKTFEDDPFARVRGEDLFKDFEKALLNLLWQQDART